MLSVQDILETNRMIEENKLDVRTITLGISLRDCGHPDVKVFCRNIYEKIVHAAERLVRTGDDIEAEYTFAGHAHFAAIPGEPTLEQVPTQTYAATMPGRKKQALFGQGR